MKYGNYCGPWWSDGKHQASVVGRSAAIDAFDETCKTHDAVYATGGNLKRADRAFYEENIGRGVVRSVAALAVGAQGALRRGEVRTPIIDQPRAIMTNLRGSTPTPQNRNKNITHSNATASLGGVQMDAPAATSSVFTAKQTKTKSIRDGTHVSGQEFISPVECQGVATFGLGKSALLAPAYFYGGVLGQLSRAYQKYRWRKLVVHYIPKVSTGLAGQVVICSSLNINEPCLQPEASSFLARAMVSGNGVMAPLWAPVKMQIPIDNEWRNIDPTVSSDINDDVYAEVQVYTQAATAQQVGYLWLEYEIELVKPMLTPHSTSLPISSGPGTRIAMQNTSAINAVGAPVTLADVSSSGLFSVPGGSIYRFVLDVQGSNSGSGTSFSNAWSTTTVSLTTAGGVQKDSSGYNIVGGSTLYLTLIQSQQRAVVYTSLEAAISGLSNGQMIQNSPSTGLGTFVGDLTLVRIGVSTIGSVQ